MQLMTSEIEKALKKYPLGSQNGKGGDAKVIPNTSEAPPPHGS